MEICETCKRKFKNKKSLSIHRRHSEKCRIEWERKENIKKENHLNNGYIICGICSEKFKTITNTHLTSHGFSMQEYKEKYGKLFADDVLKIQKKNRKKAIEEKYSNEEIKYLRGRKSIETKLKNSGFNSYSEYCKSATSISMEENPELWNARNDIISKKNKEFYSSDNYDKESINEKRRKTVNNKYGVDYITQVEEIKVRQRQAKQRRYKNG